MMEKLPKRVLDKIDFQGGQDDCWIYRGGVAHAYGRIFHQGRQIYAHRLAYEIANGPVPPGLVVTHICDVPRCVNPRHLIAATQQQNCADAHSKGRGVKGATHGMARLSEDVVQAIRCAREAGVSLKELGERFNVHLGTVHYATTSGWRHVK